MFVNFIGQHKDAFFKRPLADRTSLLLGVHRAGGVRRRDKDERFRRWGVCRLQLFDGDLIVLVASGKNLDRVAARQTDALGVGCPVRGREQNIVAVIDHGSEGFIDRLLTTVCNKYLRRIDLNAGIAQGFIRDSLFEFGQTRGGGVAEVFRIIEGFAGSINNMCGRRKIGFTGTETNYRTSGCLECFSFGIDDKGC